MPIDRAPPNVPARSLPVSREVIAALATAWVVFVALPPVGLAVVRPAWIERLSQPDVQRQWDDFRGAMRAQTGREGPVQRKVPKSVEPPQLVWLRDYFALACAAWVLFGSVLWGVTAVFVVGAASLPENQPTGERDNEEEDQGDAEDADQG